MKLLFIGDIVGKSGISAAKKQINTLSKKYQPDIVIANGENAAARNGITRDIAEDLHYAGIDVITLGNHAFGVQSSFTFLDDCEYIVRPINYSNAAPGHGSTELKTSKGIVKIISVAGRVNSDPAGDPFAVAKAESEKNTADFFFFDFHAEATSEKKAFGYYVDKLFKNKAAVFGTHTHVQTADECFLPNGTAYITDAGMTGAYESVIGATPESAINRFIEGRYIPLEQSEQSPMINGVFADTDAKIIERINERII